jgi:hypothetical protein
MVAKGTQNFSEKFFVPWNVVFLVIFLKLLDLWKQYDVTQVHCIFGNVSMTAHCSGTSYIFLEVIP